MQHFELFITSWLRSEHAESPLLISHTHESTLSDATDFARKAVACENPNDTPCGACKGCSQALAGTHANILIVEGETKTIRRQEVQEMLERTQSMPVNGKRLILIPHADRLTRESANILLKSLEEPSAYNRYILTTRFKHQILPTIRSRCQQITLPSHKNSHEAIVLSPNLALGLHQGPLSDEDLEIISRYLAQEARRQPQRLYRPYLRFRDYCKIKSRRGNEKLAADLLLASLSQLRNTALR